jgi:molecular chaperone GrpE
MSDKPTVDQDHQPAEDSVETAVTQDGNREESSGMEAGSGESVPESSEQRGTSDVAELERSLEESKELSSGIPAEDAVSREDQLQAQLERVQAEVDTNRDKWLRAMAELDNFRKRTRVHLESSLILARADVLKQLLEVLDNFERAMEAWEQAEQPPDESFVKGVRLIQDQLLRVLRENRVEKIDSIGAPFDPNLHEAVSQIETDEVESQHVARVIKEGYRFHETVLRPAMVVVAR